jgi:branched-subunit amino acid aminotransferase/4-amino-4-deoxychorismate lyase
MIENWVFLNGEFYPAAQAKISISDRGFLFGEGVFTTIHVQDQRCELFQAHCKRLEEQTNFLQIAPPTIDPEWIFHLLLLNQAFQGSWRLKIIRTANSLLMTIEPFIRASSAKKLAIFPYPLERFLAPIKSLSYLDYLYVQDYAKKVEKDDALICTKEKFILETGRANLFWIADDQYWVPDFQLPYLKGTCLQSFLRQTSHPIHFVQCTLDQVPLTANIYLCNALEHIVPISCIGDRVFPLNAQIDQWLEETMQIAIEKDYLNCAEKRVLS